MIGIKLIQIRNGKIMNMNIEKNEFDSEFSNVKYMSEDNIVFLTCNILRSKDNIVVIL
ncbi:hypothetical protein [Clostridium arbusti]|uniref:hypothetical protein n=1 Tax=Clostridium arbusti TaxID=1137848 RepID=UPI00131450E6|nr:hypothetical protein [Clostridium arbusti]